MMQKILVTLFWIELILTIYTSLVRTQSLPPIDCPENFQYLRNGGQVIGKITIPNLQLGIVKLDVELSQPGNLRTEYAGQVKPFESLQITHQNLVNGDPITYRVDFPTPNIVPKLTRILVNGNEICSGSSYPPPKAILDLTHTLTPTTTITRSRQPPRGNTVISPPQQNVISSPPISQDRDGTCGREKFEIVTKIFGGSEISRGQYPWLAAIYDKRASGLQFICGGSLINTRSVISAAHCFDHAYTLTAKQVTLYLGRHNLEDYNEQGAIAKDLQSLLIHPEYNKEAYSDADIAILHLISPVQFTENIAPICLWSGSTDIGGIEGVNGYVAGWGGNERGQSVTSTPKVVLAKVVSEVVCLRSSPTYSKLLTKRSFCAGQRDNTGPCQGDSGAGLMISRGDRWFLRGIVSAGQLSQHQCDLREYVVFCDVAKHLSWIRDNM